MFAHIPERIHNPINIYTHGDDELNLMAHGDVTHKHHYGMLSKWFAATTLHVDVSRP